MAQGSASTPPGNDQESAPAEIAFRDVVKHYPGRERAAVEKLSFTVPPGEICVLIGPSGCGKTTALKMVNRLISITDGDITIDRRSVKQLALTQLRRGIGYVFQQIGLFPHMTVEANIGSVPRLLGGSKKRIHDRARRPGSRRLGRRRGEAVAPGGALARAPVHNSQTPLGGQRLGTLTHEHGAFPPSIGIGVRLLAVLHHRDRVRRRPTGARPPAEAEADPSPKPSPYSPTASLSASSTYAEQAASSLPARAG
jgi:ABC-type dipeptide/oligopeptide/nickel transport system ATPase component